MFGAETALQGLHRVDKLVRGEAGVAAQLDVPGLTEDLLDHLPLILADSTRGQLSLSLLS